MNGYFSYIEEKLRKRDKARQIDETQPLPILEVLPKEEKDILDTFIERINKLIRGK